VRFKDAKAGGEKEAPPARTNKGEKEEVKPARPKTVLTTPGLQLTVLYGSNLGTAKEFAEQLVDQVTTQNNRPFITWPEAIIIIIYFNI
jgi:hypothetical protein